MGDNVSVSHVDANDWEHDEETADLRPGVTVAMPKGTHTRWVVDDEFRELWIYSSP
jgi:uncharacterized cupin superfamily protein